MSERFVDRKYRAALTETPHPCNQGKHEPREMASTFPSVDCKQWKCPHCDNIHEQPIDDWTDSVWCTGDSVVESREP